MSSDEKEIAFLSALSLVVALFLVAVAFGVVGR